jgi:hypothetical protein
MVFTQAAWCSHSLSEGGRFCDIGTIPSVSCVGDYREIPGGLASEISFHRPNSKLSVYDAPQIFPDFQ